MVEVKMIWLDEDYGPNIDISIYQPMMEEDFHFNVAKYKISGVIFTEWSKEMEKTIQQMVIIDKLSN